MTHPTYASVAEPTCVRKCKRLFGLFLQGNSLCFRLHMRQFFERALKVAFYELHFGFVASVRNLYGNLYYFNQRPIFCPTQK